MSKAEAVGPASFEGWAVVEMMGHRKEIGYVTTEHYGAAALFRVDTPGFEEREYVLERPEYLTVNGQYRMVPVGSRVKRQGMPARTVLVGPSSVYALNPCTEEVAKRAIERTVARPLVLLSIPENAQLAAGDYEHDPDVDEEPDEDF